MALKLMYITNRIDVALVAEAAGVDRIFVDLEYIGKAERQRGMNTVQNHHTAEDVRKIKNVLKKALLLARVNPIHTATDEYVSSEEEINAVIDAGADIVMLPYFKTADEVKTFIDIVNGRAKTLLLVETPQAAENIDEILAFEGIDEVFIGLNDLSLGYNESFMFEPLADGTVEMLCKKFEKKGIPFGFGGIASLGKGMLPSEYIIPLHYKLGSSCVILSRSFCDANQIVDASTIESSFIDGVRKIREYEYECEKITSFDEIEEEMKKRVARIVSGI